MRDLSQKKSGEDEERKEERNATCRRGIARESSKNTNGIVVLETKKKENTSASQHNCILTVQHPFSIRN